MEKFATAYDGDIDFVINSCNKAALVEMGWREATDLDKEMKDGVYVVLQYDPHICTPQLLVAIADWDNGFRQIGNTWDVDRIDFWMRITPSSAEFSQKFMRNAVCNALCSSPLFTVLEKRV
jgi:hypothetical protein